MMNKRQIRTLDGAARRALIDMRRTGVPARDMKFANPNLAGWRIEAVVSKVTR